MHPSLWLSCSQAALYQKPPSYSDGHGSTWGQHFLNGKHGHLTSGFAKKTNTPWSLDGVVERLILWLKNENKEIENILSAEMPLFCTFGGKTRIFGCELGDLQLMLLLTLQFHWYTVCFYHRVAFYRTSVHLLSINGRKKLLLVFLYSSQR